MYVNYIMHTLCMCTSHINIQHANTQLEHPGHDVWAKQLRLKSALQLLWHRGGRSNFQQSACMFAWELCGFPHCWGMRVPAIRVVVAFRGRLCRILFKKGYISHIRRRRVQLPHVPSPILYTNYISYYINYTFFLNATVGEMSSLRIQYQCNLGFSISPSR